MWHGVKTGMVLKQNDTLYIKNLQARFKKLKCNSTHIRFNKANPFPLHTLVWKRLGSDCCIRNGSRFEPKRAVIACVTKFLSQSVKAGIATLSKS